MQKWTTILILVLLIGASYGIARNIIVSSEAEAKQKLRETITLSKNYCEIISQTKTATTSKEVDDNPIRVTYVLFYSDGDENKSLEAFADTTEKNENKIKDAVAADCEQKFALLQEQTSSEPVTVTIQYSGLEGQKYDLETKEWANEKGGKK